MMYLRKLLIGLAALLAFALPAVAQAPAADDTWRVALHVNDNDVGKMNLTLNNVQNILADFKKSNRKVEIEVVTYGPGLHMFREDTSPVKARIQDIALGNPNVRFAACNNTAGNMAKAEKKEIKIMSEATIVPSGVVHLVELQRKGFAYVKP
jgi:intracellular sulfur oxidation DsrE/DsrF family protein